MNLRSVFLPLVVVWLFCNSASGQTPTPEPATRVVTEEIRLNVGVRLRSGETVVEVGKEDLVITEDGRLHQPASVRKVPASVLIAMDTGGGTIRQKKNLETTRSATSALVGELAPGSHVSVLQFHDRADPIIGWTTEKGEVLKAVDAKTTFGRRSSFTPGIEEAGRLLAAAPTENRHLVLITDGIDAINADTVRAEAVRKLWQSGVVVHVISYTQLEVKGQRILGGLLQKGEDNPRRIPDEMMEQLIYAIPVKKTIAREILRQIYQPRLLSVIIDRPFLRAQKDQTRDLAAAQAQLSVLSEYTGGDFFLPDTLDEFTEHAFEIARNINGQFVVTYVPKRALSEVVSDEIRTIEVTSRRPHLDARATRKLVVFGPAERK